MVEHGCTARAEPAVREREERLVDALVVLRQAAAGTRPFTVALGPVAATTSFAVSVLPAAADWFRPSSVFMTSAASGRVQA